MTFEQYLAILIKRWWFVLLCCLAVGVGAYVGSKFLTPLYQSTALIQVSIRSSSNQADYNGLLASEQLVQTEAQLATSDPVLNEVASHSKGISVATLMHEVSASPRANTQLFEIDVLDPSPNRAALIANDVTVTLIKQQSNGAAQDNAQSQQQIQQDLDATQTQINDLTGQIVSLQGTSGRAVQVAVLQAKIQSLQAHYNQWQTLLAELKLSETQNSNFLRQVQMALPNGNPVQPNRTLYVGAGLALGLLIGLLMIVLIELLDTRVRTQEALAELLAWPVLATIWQKNAKEEMINVTGRDINVESYRMLRTNLGFSAVDKPLHTIMVTSALPNDGKSVIAANLAIFMARAGKMTLLVDADMRRPVQHLHFDLAPDKRGLSNAVLAMGVPTSVLPRLPKINLDDLSTRPVVKSGGTADSVDFPLEPFVHAISSIPNLWVMPSGPLPPNPPELLDSKSMKSVLNAIAGSSFEIVIFDSPPLLGLSDSGILASRVDGLLPVIDVSRAHKGSLRQMKALLDRTGTRVVGCVINKQRRRRDVSYYAQYYQVDEEKSGDTGASVPLSQNISVSGNEADRTERFGRFVQ